MFTGIITDIGEIIERRGDSYRIRSHYPADGIEIGASIACAGCCLTVTELEADGAGSIFAADVSNETRSKTTLDEWAPGTRINLERSLRAGDELGGHIVTGHVDGVAVVTGVEDDGESRRFRFEVPDHLAPYIAPKGAVAIDGASLTVNEVGGNTFGINLIPHTLTVTTWGERNAGSKVNLEVDLFARYMARLMEFRT